MTPSASPSACPQAGSSSIDRRVGETGPNPVAAVNQAKRIATTLADHLKDELATKRDLDVLRAELKADMATLRNQLLTAQVAASVGIILDVTFRL